MGEVISEGCGAMPATQGRFAPVSVAVEGLGKSYGDVAILEDISFSVEGGTSVAFVSPSGSGKSTLLSMLGLLLTPTAGQVRLNGGERLHHYPYQLSIGQKRRVATARALMMHPPILIADEPTNDLDAESTRSVADVLFEHVGRGGILLFATHDQALAARADRVMHLEGKTFVEG